MWIHRRRFSLIRVPSALSLALQQNIPVVALESTIIAHGMPFPRNLEVAKEVENVIRKAGAIPATVGILHGVPIVGMNADELALMADPATGVHKCSRRDLAFFCAKKAHAATTVATTSYLAAQTGISVFATGGLGGVHRGVEETMDISADLYELSRIRMTVVCSGVKSILDIPKTLEVLETYGVPVLTYRSDIFPAFFTNDSGIKSQHRVESAEQVARMMIAVHSLGMENGMIVAVPNPSPADAFIQDIITDAVAVAEQRGISGARVTPFLLDYINKATGGKSLDANVELILNNAKVAAEIALMHSQLQLEAQAVSSDHNISVHASAEVPASSPPPVEPKGALVVCIGGAVVDMIGSLTSPLIMRSSNPGALQVSYGGVARNIAEGIGRQGGRVVLLTAVGGDAGGKALLEHARLANVDVSGVIVDEESRTATYTAIHEDATSGGELVAGLADMDIFTKTITHEAIEEHSELLEAACIIVCDGNISADAFTAITELKGPSTKLVFDGTSDHKVILPLEAEIFTKGFMKGYKEGFGMIDVIKVNMSELRVLVNSVQGVVEEELDLACYLPDGHEDADEFEAVVTMAYYLHKVMASWHNEGKGCFNPKTVLVSMGAEGLICIGGPSADDKLLSPIARGLSSPLIIDDESWEDPEGVYIPALPVASEQIVNSSGAGDCFVAGVVYAMAQNEEDSLDAFNGEHILRGMQAARLSLRSVSPVPANMDISTDFSELYKGNERP